MNHEEKLVDVGSPLERALFRVAAEDGPEPSLEDTVLSALARAEALGSSRASVTGIAPRWIRPWTWGKIGRISVFTLGSVVAVYAAVGRSRSTEKHSTPEVSALPSPPRIPLVESVTTIPLGSGDPSHEVTPLAESPPETKPKGHVRIDRTEEPSNRPQPSEVQMLDEARTSLQAGAGKDALMALNRYDTAYPQGALRPEATLLRVRALLLAGEKARARAVADQFIAVHPKSIYVRRIRIEVGDDVAH